MAATSRKAFKLLKRSFSSKDMEKERKVFTYNAEDLALHQLISDREEALSEVPSLACALFRTNLNIHFSLMSF